MPPLVRVPVYDYKPVLNQIIAQAETPRMVWGAEYVYIQIGSILNNHASAIVQIVFHTVWSHSYRNRSAESQKILTLNELTYSSRLLKFKMRNTQFLGKISRASSSRPDTTIAQKRMCLMKLLRDACKLHVYYYM